MGSAPNVYGPSPNQGQSPNQNQQAAGGAESRLTSGGGAAAVDAQDDFSCKATLTLTFNYTRSGVLLWLPAAARGNASINSHQKRSRVRDHHDVTVGIDSLKLAARCVEWLSDYTGV